MEITVISTLRVQSNSLNSDRRLPWLWCFERANWVISIGRVMGDFGENTFKRECLLCHRRARSPVVTKCGHLFCYDCIMEHIGKSETCPACDEPVPGDSLIPIFGHGKQKLEQNQRKTDNADHTDYRGDFNTLTIGQILTPRIVLFILAVICCTLIISITFVTLLFSLGSRAEGDSQIFTNMLRFFFCI